MGITLFAAQSIGDDAYDCRLETYYRTIVYELPNYVLDDELAMPGILHDTSDLRAAVVTDPVDYLRGSDFSDQFRSDANSADELRDKLGDFTENAGGRLCIVIQLRQDLGSFPAVDGQCRKINGELALINCDGPYVPAIDDPRDRINTLLAAIKMELDITDGFVKHLDTPIYRTDDGDFVHWLNVQVSAAVGSVIRHIGIEDLTAKIAATRGLCGQIDQAMTASSVMLNPKLKQSFPERLAELMDGLQLEPSHDDAYRRLWYLQLWHRAEKFGRAIKGQVLNRDDLTDERDHRNDIAHPSVDRADGRLLQSFQQKLFGIIRYQVCTTGCSDGSSG